MEPKISKNQFKKAGKILAKKQKDIASEKVEKSEALLATWRKMHIPLLDLFEEHFEKIKKRTLNKKKNRVYYTAQRLKRRESIIKKLRRESTTQLTTIQDIAGFRIICPNLKELNHLKEILEAKKEVNGLILKRTVDYIYDKQKPSGYKSIHLIYSHVLANGTELLLEVQIRTELQHIWATTLEIVGAVNSEDLKAGEGNRDILSFFALVSSAFFINEKKKASSEELSSKTFSIYDKIITQYKKLHIESLLKKHDDIKEKFDGATSGNIHILDQNLQNNCLVIHSYSSEQQDKANARYSTLEKEAQQTPDIRNIVLTKADSLDNLKRAYPNYFINPNGFIEEIKKMKDAISERKASLRTSKKMRIVMWLVIIAWTLVLSYVILT